MSSHIHNFSWPYGQKIDRSKYYIKICYLIIVFFIINAVEEIPSECFDVDVDINRS